MKLHSVPVWIVALVWHRVAAFCEGFQLSVPTIRSVSRGSHQRKSEGGEFSDSSVRCKRGPPYDSRGPRISMSALGSATSDDDEEGGEETPAPLSGDEPGTVTSTQEKSDAVGNLVVNDEWEGLTMELTEVIRTAVMEDIKANAREFLGKDNYELGDLSKEIDARVKTEVANLRGKEVT
jgi:hypothetical protein